MKKVTTVGKKHPDPTPQHFGSYEEAAEFWENHDTTNYLDKFRAVEVEGALCARRFEVESE